MTRTSHQIVVDEPSYTYRGNQLLHIEDAGGEAGFAVTTSYEYDQNGNMIKDQARGLEFEYNVLNLPHREKAKDIVWEYAYDRTKLSVTEAKNNGYVYLGSCIYNRRLGNYTLESIVFSEGLITFDGTDYTTHYFLRDHLGSVRAVVNAASHAIEEQNDYYPFGARMYDPAIGRWLTADPKSESYYSLSSYPYCSNNPLMFVDPDGTFVTHYVDKEYNILLQTNDGSDDVVMVHDAWTSSFKEFASLYSSANRSEVFNSSGWNNH